MHHDPRNALHVDPLGQLEVQRALALARARESYPAIPRETLLGYCEAAWDVALKADPRGRDLQGSFDRALLIIAWTQRRSGGRVPLRELVDQTVPRIALEPFISEPGQPAVAERQPEVGVQAEEPRPVRRSPLRVPFTSPIPVGAAVAAGVVGFAVLSETEVLPIAPLQPTGSDDASTDDGVAARDRDSGRAQSGSGSGAGSSDSGAIVTGLLPSGLGEAARQAVPVEPAPAPAVGEARQAGSVRSVGSKDEPKSQPTAQVAANAVTGGAVAPAAPPAPPPSVAVAPAPPAEPVVRLEMAPATMVIEVSAPLSDIDDDHEPDESDEGGPDTSLPGSDESGDQVDPQPDEDDDDESDLLVDATQPGHGDDDEDDLGDEAPPVAPLPVTPAPAPPAPVAPATPPVQPVAPAPAPQAPATPAPALAETAPTTTTPAPAVPAPAETAPAAPAPAPAAPAPAPTPAAPPTAP
jgi:hypothetical protein